MGTPRLLREQEQSCGSGKKSEALETSKMKRPFRRQRARVHLLRRRAAHPQDGWAGPAAALH